MAMEVICWWMRVTERDKFTPEGEKTIEEMEGDFWEENSQQLNGLKVAAEEKRPMRLVDE